MPCPLFVDYSRECVSQIEVYPHELTADILDYCSTNNHDKCPFYKILKTDEDVCKNIKKCAAFKNFQVNDFNSFVKISNQYCTSPQYTTCQRYILSKKGEDIPLTLHPNGKHIKEWEEKNN